MQIGFAIVVILAAVSLEASTESQMKKLNQQKARRKKAEDKELKLEEFEEPAYDDNTNMQMEDKD